MTDLGIKTTYVMKTDSIAAKGKTNRRGRGQLKHMPTRELRLQGAARDKMIDFQKVGTKDTPSDLKIKHLGSNTATQHLDRLNAKTTTGWRVLAPRK